MIALSSQVIAMNIAATTASAMRRRRRLSLPDAVGKAIGWAVIALVFALALVAAR